jgi:hypothetical protein
VKAVFRILGVNDVDGATEGSFESDGATEGIIDGVTEGSFESDGAKEGMIDGATEGMIQVFPSSPLLPQRAPPEQAAVISV